MKKLMVGGEKDMCYLVAVWILDSHTGGYRVCGGGGGGCWVKV